MHRLAIGTALSFALSFGLWGVVATAWSAEPAMGGLARKDAKPVESIPGVSSEYGSMRTRNGTRLRTIVTKPRNAQGRLPAILFVQWLSCDTVEVGPKPTDGWNRMLRGVIQSSGMLMWRTEKRGVGDSEGDCTRLDYETELADHKQALDALRQRADVDPRRIVIFGASMGSNYAPLLAADQNLAGVVVWGGGAAKWYERMVRFERNALTLQETAPDKLRAEMAAREAFFTRYLIRGETPAAIVKSDPQLGAVWQRIVGTDATSHYGRPFAFHQQAQRRDWAGAWARVRAPVLVLYGEYDWFETSDAAARIASIVNGRRPGAAEFRLLPRTDHHFTRFPSREAAFRDTDGTPDAKPADVLIVAWLKRVAAPRT